MSSASQRDKKVIESKSELVEWFEGGNTPAEKRLIGVEHEKPPFYLDNNGPVPFIGENGRAGISDFIAKMATERGWSPAAPENGIVLSVEKGNTNWTFEPAGQMELGGAPLKNVHQNAEETDRTIKEAVEVTKELGFGMLAMGFHPTHLSKDLPLMPKSRYKALFDWFADRKFPTAADVASSTSTVQVNMGYQNEADMVKMLRVSLSLQPIAVAMFATSPFEKGELSGYQSTRSHKLYKNMGGRYGFMLPIAFDPGFGFEMFTDYALNTMPMLGVYKGTSFLDAKGAMFQDFIDGKLDILPGQKATLGDWQNHLNTIWPEVRVRRFLEMRGTDVGPQEMIKALPAFWVGLLYDKQSLDAAYEMVKDWDDQDRDYLRVMTPETGLQTKFLNTTVQEIAKNALALSEAGLKRRAILNDKGQDETIYLEPLKEIVESGRNWAVRLEEKFNGEWKGDIARVFNEMNYGNNPSVLTTSNGLVIPANSNQPKKLILPGDKDFKAPKQ
ncbi:MAG TPA: glutamate-cysteine ligase family protein [Patescibacteria group bacterium]|nr:glutamate-cysteine ligase family protein [Patescibacteria group bacterium]